MFDRKIAIGSLLMATLFLSGCHCDGPDSRTLTGEFQFQSASPHGELTRIWAKGATPNERFNESVQVYNNGHKDQNVSIYMSLPLSTISDETTYYFQFGDHVDSLTVAYKRSFRYDDNCGFIAQSQAISGGVWSSFSQVTQPYPNQKGSYLSLWIKP